MTHFQDIWAQLPIVGLVIGVEDNIQEINAAAELFLGISSKVALGQHVWNYLRGEDLLPAGIDRARILMRPIVIAEVVAHGRNSEARLCAAHVCPLNGDKLQVLILLSPHEVFGNSGNGLAPVSAAHSAIGMAEMLAHEIKNPLAGITGAAQLLSLSLPPKDHEMTDLIVKESKRIVALLDQVEQFGDVTPPSCAAVNIHDVLDQAVRSATFGFAGDIQISKNYDPSLPHVWADADQMVQVFLNLIKNACEALGDKGKYRCAPSMIRICVCCCLIALVSVCHCMLISPITAQACLKRLRNMCLIRSYHQKATGRASASLWFQK